MASHQRKSSYQDVRLSFPSIMCIYFVLYYGGKRETQMIKPIGITNDVTTCECCGRANLKSTVVMQDDEGNISYWGCDCAGKALGRSAAKISAAARGAQNKTIANNAHYQGRIDSIMAIDRDLINLTLRERLHERGWNDLGLNQPMKPEARREIYVAWMRAKIVDIR